MPNIAFLSTAHTHTKGFLKAVSERDGSDIVAIWDDMENRGQNFANEYGAEFSADLDAVVGRDDVDGFIVCVENTKHLPLLEAAIPTKKPIFCEKPFMTTVEDALKAVSLIREHGTIVHMGYFQPFSAEMQGVIAHVDSGALGNLTHARYRNAHHAAYGRWFDSDELAWFHNPALAGGGAFMDMGTHAVHLMRTILGPVKEVLATISNVSGIYNDVDDNGVAMFRFENGVVISFGFRHGLVVILCFAWVPLSVGREFDVNSVGFLCDISLVFFRSQSFLSVIDLQYLYFVFVVLGTL